MHAQTFTKTHMHACTHKKESISKKKLTEKPGVVMRSWDVSTRQEAVKTKRGGLGQVWSTWSRKDQGMGGQAAVACPCCTRFLSQLPRRLPFQLGSLFWPLSLLVVSGGAGGMLQMKLERIGKSFYLKFVCM